VPRRRRGALAERHRLDPLDGAPNIEQGPYAVFDLNASYDVNEQTELALSVNNVLDEKYYASTSFYRTVIYGDGISAEMMLRARF
jgi:outer membrane receptor for ferric coprogen and ferric-rhodotorulic acid